jgi:hypothetical protein
MKTYGQAAFEAYAAHTDNKTFDGREIPRWEDLTIAVREAWERAADAAVLASHSNLLAIMSDSLTKK